MKNHGLILFPAVVLLLVLASCKHKQKAIEAREKHVVKIEKKDGPDSGKRVEPGGKTALEQKLGLSEREIGRSKLYSFVNEWYGIPYKYGGCQKTGVDCSCFASILYERVYGKELPRVAGDMYNQCDMIGIEDAKEGDLFFFKINGNRISHVGVMVKDNYFVHASTSKGVMLSNINEAYYKKYFFSAGRLRKS